MTERNQVYLVALNFELIDHPVISNAQAKGIGALHPIMGKGIQPAADRVDFRLDALLKIERKPKEPVIKAMRINLSRGAGHTRLKVSGRERVPLECRLCQPRSLL
jgi:hypothetical protein